MNRFINKYQRLIAYIALSLIVVVVFREFFFSPYDGLYLYYDDATNQLLRFYQEMWETVVADGQLFKMWDWSNVLGANYIASNSYYNLLSPFTIPFYFFPKEMIPDLLLYLNMLKLIVIGIIGYEIGSHYTEKFSIRFIVMLILTFNGWIFAYAKYMFMWDAYVFMLLIILGIERYIKYNKRGLLFISTMLLGVVNYYFLYMFSFIVVIWYLFRLHAEKGSLLTNRKNILDFALVYFFGIMGSMIVFLPSILNVMNSDRLSGETTIFATFSQLFRYFTGYFAEPRIYGSFNGFLDYRFGAAGWNGGMSFYSFMITPLLLPQILINKDYRNQRILYLIITVMVCLIPVYTLLSGSLESRWFIIIVIANAYMVSKVLDNGVDFRMLIMSIIVMLGIVFAVNQIVSYRSLQDSEILKITTDHAYLYIVISGIALIICSKFKFEYILPLALLVELLVFNPLQHDDLSVKRYAYTYNDFEAMEYIKDNLDTDYRTDIFDIQSNVIFPMLNIQNTYNIGGFSGYHSVYNYLQDDFLNGRMKKEGEWYIFNQPYKMGLKNTLSNRYWIANLNNTEESMVNPPIAYEIVTELDDGYVIYENKYPLEIVQFKTNSISYSDFFEYSIMEQDIILRNNVVLENSIFGFQDDLMLLEEFTQAEEGDIIYISHSVEDYVSKEFKLFNDDNLVFSESSFLDFSYVDFPVHDTVNKVELSGVDNFEIYVERDYEETLKQYYEKQLDYVSDMSIDKETVSCIVNADIDGYIVTSIPYDKGWTIRIDGEKVTAENINNGFIGAFVEEGQHEVELTYFTPGLTLGIIMSLTGVIGFIVMEYLRRRQNEQFS